jgi:cytochrome c6
MRIEKSGAILLSMLLGSPWAYAADTQNGAKLYGQYCASCHAANGKGAIAGAPDFARGRVLSKPDGALLSSIKAGKGAMPGFLGILRERDLFDVIAYMRTLN